MWKAALVFLLGCLPTAAAGAAGSPLYGQPLQQRFGIEHHDADPASYDVLSLPDGSLLFANGAGLVHYDGSRWALFELPGVSPGRALQRGRDGRIYVGGYDQFGRLDIDPTGRFRYVDLRGEFGVDGVEATFGIIWEILGTSRGLFFRSDETLFFLGYQGERERWPLGADYRRMFVVDDQLYTRRHGSGFGRLDAEGFSLAPGGATFAEQPLASLIERPDGLLLVGDGGFHLATERGIRPLPSGADEALRRREPSTALALPDGGLLLGTNQGELVHLNAGLELVAVYALGSFSVLDLGQDREGGVWVATEGDLVRLRLPSPWSAFGAADGLAGSPLDTAFLDGRLWVASSAGVFRSERREGELVFEHAISTSLEANTLLADSDGLLIGDRAGLLWYPLASGRSQRLFEADTVFELIRSTFHPQQVFALANDALFLLQRDGAGWLTQARWALDGMSIGTLLEIDAQSFWLDDWRGVPQRWRYAPDSGELLQRERFDRESGIEWDPALGTGLHRLAGELYAVSGYRVFRLEGERFQPFGGAPFSLFERPFDIGLTETAQGDFAYSARKLYRRIPGTDDWQLAPLGSGIARGFFGMQADADGKLRMKTWGGLLQFDPEVDEPPLMPLAVSLAGWSLRSADSEPQALPLQPGGALAIGPGDLLSFDFRMPTMEPGVEFRYRIDGLDSGWSEWAPPGHPSLSLRAPDPGRYRLQVEGRTRNGRIGAPLDFAFSVQPAWWQTRWALLGAASAALLLLLLAAQLIARLRYRHFLATNRRLEQKIAERTAELETANRKLAELATEDSLTGVANRRALEQALNREWERCGELDLPLALIMLDVDHFKQFNDDHGHLEGDKQLVRVARELAGRVRPVRELLARFGGEEFAVILPGVGLEEALARAETMRAAFDRDSFPTTVSVGVAAEVPDPARTPTDLLRAADQALYAAKRQGRNRVSAAAA